MVDSKLPQERVKGKVGCIFAFDNVLYLDLENNDQKVNPDFVIDHEYFLECFQRQHPSKNLMPSNAPKILITARHFCQEHAVLEVLEKKGIKILQSFFFSFTKDALGPRRYEEYLISFKANEIARLTHYYETLLIFESDEQICRTLRSLELPSLRIFKVTLFKDTPQGFIEFTEILQNEEMLTEVLFKKNRGK